MNQHPIPQNIATYQFRLIGSMTLKQFMELIIGLALAILTYKSNLFFPIKAVLALGFGIFAIAAAFLPYDDRPLDTWINIFLKAIYAPTQFLWQKHAPMPAYFDYSPQKRALTAEETQALFNAAINKKRAGLASYLQTISPNPYVGNLEKNEGAHLSALLTLFNNPSASKLTVSPLLTTPAPPPAPLPSKPHSTPPLPPPIVAPPVQPVAIPRAPTPPPSAPPPTPVAKAVSQPLPTKKTLYPPGPTPHADPASHSAKLPFPIKPTTPNTVVGMVFDPLGRIIENAIIEIRDAQGNPVRATKTNKLGQFFSTTPLKNGHYELEIDAPPHQFAILKLELNNRLLDPLEIKAQV